MRDRDAANRKAITSNDPRDWEKYKKLRNIMSNNIKISKASYYSNAFNDHFSTTGPDLLSYINNINVNNNKFSFSSTNCSIVFSHLNKLCRSKVLIMVLIKIYANVLILFQFHNVMSLINL